MVYELKPSDDSLKFVEKLGEKEKRKLKALMDVLRINPIPFRQYDLKKLKGMHSFFRIRVGKIRMIYEIRESEQRIYIHHVRFRESAYD